MAVSVFRRGTIATPGGLDDLKSIEARYPAAGMSISIIIPTLNEAPRIGEQVRACLTLRPRPEVLVVDGGSADGTLERAWEAGAHTHLSEKRGRAAQMNTGAALARGDLLLFLHADVTLPSTAFAELNQAMADPRLLGGAFARRFDAPSILLNWGCRLADLRGKWLRIFLGDQAMFVRKDIFHRMGGFSDYLLFEDVALSRALKKLGKTRLLSSRVIASSRRFEREGHFRRLRRNIFLTSLYLLGRDPDRLARSYYPGYFPPQSPGGEAGTSEEAADPRRISALRHKTAGFPGGDR